MAYEDLEKQSGKYCNAVVVSDKSEKEYKDVYEIEIQNISDSDKRYNGIKLILNLKKSKEKKLELNYGDKISFCLEYEKPNKARNYMGFDYSLYLRTKKVYGTANIKPEDVQIVNKDQTNIVFSKINELRHLMKKKIDNLLPKETAGLCLGMLIGETSEIEESMQEDFRDSNLSHILAVSGSNVSYIIVSITYIFNKICFRKKLSKITSIFLLLLFMLLTGCTASVNRACIMAIIMLIADLLYRKSDVYNNLAISALILLIINPYSILDIGFQLSYAGTIGIVFLHDKICKFIKVNNKIIKYILEMIYVTTCANIAIIPIMMFHFNTLSLTFYISNILAGPLLGIIVIIGFMMFFISLILEQIAIPIAFILNIMLSFVIKIAEFTANIPFSKIIVTTPSIFEIISWYSVIFLIIYRNIVKRFYNKHRKIINATISILLIIVIVSNLVIKINSKLKVYFIDVGQGDSCLIVTPSNKKILIDGGGSETGSFDVGEKILLPYLLDRNIKQLDYVMISHFDSDHVGGILTIMEKIKVKKIAICNQGKSSKNYKKFLKIVKNKNINVDIVKDKNKITIDKDAYFYILHPAKDLINNNILNNNSIVTKFCYKNFSMLFTGDIEDIAEKDLLERYRNTKVLKSTVLKVGHHGSKTSSTKELLDNVKPKIALVGVGSKNTFGHPSKGVLDRLEDINCKIYRTDLNGEIILTVDNTGKVHINTMF